MALQPEESLEAIYEWVGDWDQTWASIYLWWKYINKNEISILKVHDANLHDMTEETTMQQNKVIQVVIAIADLCQPEGQQRFHIDDVFEDYQEQVKERAHLEAERLAKAPAVHTQGQTARDKGQEHAPEDTKGHLSRGAACSTGEGSGSTSKGKGKQKATSKEDELADNVDDDEGNGEPGPSTKGPCTAGDNEPCKTCAQANLVCIREPEASCKWCRKAKCKCSCSRGIGRKIQPLQFMILHPHLISFSMGLLQHLDPVNTPCPTLPVNEPQIEFKPFSAIATSLLNELGGTEEPVWGNMPLGTEIPEVEIPCKRSTASFVKCLQVLKARAKDEEFKLEQVYQLLEMLARWVTYQIKTVWARWEELRRLKDNLWDL
ncbi:hypothetical protein M404DRAFT_30985 [Pisolithus tinctorius Marx 270]|uniref:Uncharacterized protein n=1 Tax=Pisolithus tinctorius Marx 270 TaxID=870435 RepID=A0A0C3JMV0_PISTI|nr:hypothetical protein M404DRAFT_30985 [Pisolithus tinctorius Marx 270]